MPDGSTPYRNRNEWTPQNAGTPHAGMFRNLNVARMRMFRFLNVSRSRDRNRLGELGRRCRLPWPLTARVPIVSGALILAVAIAVSHVMMHMVASEQEAGVRQTAAVYLDGISTTIYPHVAARNLANTIEALHRTMWFHQGMQEQRAIVRLPDGTLFADVSAPDINPAGDDPVRDPELGRRLALGQGFVFDENTGTGWAARAIIRDDRHVADLYVALELRPLLQERQRLRNHLLAATVLAGLAAAAIGFQVVRRMVLPVRFLTDRLRRAQAGDLAPVQPALLPPASSEYGRLLRGYNDLVAAVVEREILAANLAQRERESMLGRLAATIAHEVRNPLGGMSTALDTARKFGDDPAVRGRALDLIERGLWSIRDVVSSVLTFHRMPPDARKLLPADIDDLRILVQREVARRNLTLTWQSEIADAVDIAATETRQIALNLLLNACEASPPGSGIGFRVTTETGPAGLPELTLEVTDSGPGLPPEIVAALAEEDMPSDHDHPRGLGLRVIRDLLRGLGGRAAVAPLASGAGTRITVTLPVAA